MAKMKRIVALCAALVLCIGLMATPAMAYPFPGFPGMGGFPGGNNPDYSDQYEWYQVYVQGNLIASGQSNGGDMYYLGTHYTAGITADGPIVTWYIQTHGGYGNSFGGTADLRNYISIPDGFEIASYEIEESSVDGVNSAYGSAYFDNAVIKITIKTLYNEITKEEIEVPEAIPSKVTVNHVYSTYDAYTGETTEDGTVSNEFDVIEGNSFHATPVTTYNDNEYEVNGEIEAIVIKAEASENVVTIHYIRNVDTTPETPPTEPPATEPPATEPPATEPPATEPPATEPPATEPPATEPPATEPPATEPPATEPPATEPPATEPPATEPPATEPPATEPPATEPPATEPPATEPPATEPPATEPPATEPPATEPPATEPPATEPPATQPPVNYDVNEQDDDGLIDIFDDNVPLADVPQTGDISALWLALTGISAGGLFLLNKKKEE